ncbi:MAG: TetR family transcriptional regulator C-terminal domain-containing protein [Coriobacteriia bacterium]|nr:TetR family transcriptional regulator C-terminal domain-containing protein [Coriobacteriia bacterium]
MHPITLGALDDKIAQSGIDSKISARESTVAEVAREVAARATDVLSPTWRRETISAKTDRRSRRTRNRLATALVTLLHDKPLNAITVKELTELADVNRATFYAHYRDVFGMYSQVKSDICQMFRELVDTHAEEIGREDYRNLLRDLFAYFASNDDASAVIIGSSGDGTFLSDIIDVIREGSFDAISRFASPQVAALRIRNEALCEYYFNFLAGGVASMLRSWVFGGCRESVDAMAAIATTYVEGLNQDMLKHSIEEYEAAIKSTERD